MMNKPTQNLSLGTHHPNSEMRNSQSDTPQSPPAMQHPTSAIRAPTSDIRYLPSEPPHPPSDIRNPSPHIRNPQSAIRNPQSFVHLHVHSHYSMMWGVSSVTRLCKKAAEAGCEYLALTDTNGLYGLIHFLEAARQYGIRPIVGANLQINGHAVGGAPAGNPSTRDSTRINRPSPLSTQHPALSTQHSPPITHHPAPSTPHSSLITHHSSLATHLVILAKTPRGYELLTELLTQRHLKENFSLFRDFPEAPEDLAVLSSNPDIIKALRSRAECWIEVVPGPAGRQALKLARSSGVPPIATNAVYFATRRITRCTAWCGPSIATAP